MYSTLEDIKKLLSEETLIELTDDENLGEAGQSRIDEAIAQADAVIDSYCGGRYAVPFSTVPAVVKKMSADIAIYNLYCRRVDEMPETKAERYKNTLLMLEGVSKGTVSLGDPSASAGGAESNTETDGRIFSREKLKGF